MEKLSVVYKLIEEKCPTTKALGLLGGDYLSFSIFLHLLPNESGARSVFPLEQVLSSPQNLIEFIKEPNVKEFIVDVILSSNILDLIRVVQSKEDFSKVLGEDFVQATIKNLTGEISYYSVFYHKGILWDIIESALGSLDQAKEDQWRMFSGVVKCNDVSLEEISARFPKFSDLIRERLLYGADGLVEKMSTKQIDSVISTFSKDEILLFLSNNDEDKFCYLSEFLSTFSLEDYLNYLDNPKFSYTMIRSSSLFPEIFKPLEVNHLKVFIERGLLFHCSHISSMVETYFTKPKEIEKLIKKFKKSEDFDERNAVYCSLLNLVGEETPVDAEQEDFGTFDEQEDSSESLTLDKIFNMDISLEQKRDMMMPLIMEEYEKDFFGYSDLEGPLVDLLIPAMKKEGIPADIIMDIWWVKTSHAISHFSFDIVLENIAKSVESEVMEGEISLSPGQVSHIVEYMLKDYDEDRFMLSSLLNHVYINFPQTRQRLSSIIYNHVEDELLKCSDEEKILKENKNSTQLLFNPNISLPKKYKIISACRSYELRSIFDEGDLCVEVVSFIIKKYYPFKDKEDKELLVNLLKYQSAQIPEDSLSDLRDIMLKTKGCLDVYLNNLEGLSDAQRDKLFSKAISYADSLRRILNDCPFTLSAKQEQRVLKKAIAFLKDSRIRKSNILNFISSRPHLAADLLEMLEASQWDSEFFDLYLENPSLQNVELGKKFFNGVSLFYDKAKILARVEDILEEVEEFVFYTHPKLLEFLQRAPSKQLLDNLDYSLLSNESQWKAILPHISDLDEKLYAQLVDSLNQRGGGIEELWSFSIARKAINDAILKDSLSIAQYNQILSHIYDNGGLSMEAAYLCFMRADTSDIYHYFDYADGLFEEEQMYSIIDRVMDAHQDDSVFYRRLDFKYLKDTTKDYILKKIPIKSVPSKLLRIEDVKRDDFELEHLVDILNNDHSLWLRLNSTERGEVVDFIIKSNHQKSMFYLLADAKQIGLSDSYIEKIYSSLSIRSLSKIKDKNFVQDNFDLYKRVVSISLQGASFLEEDIIDLLDVVAEDSLMRRLFLEKYNDKLKVASWLLRQDEPIEAEELALISQVVRDNLDSFSIRYVPKRWWSLLFDIYVAANQYRLSTTRYGEEYSIILLEMGNLEVGRLSGLDDLQIIEELNEVQRGFVRGKLEELSVRPLEIFGKFNLKTKEFIFDKDDDKIYSSDIVVEELYEINDQEEMMKGLMKFSKKEIVVPATLKRYLNTYHVFVDIQSFFNKDSSDKMIRGKKEDILLKIEELSKISKNRTFGVEVELSFCGHTRELVNNMSEQTNRKVMLAEYDDTYYNSWQLKPDASIEGSSDFTSIEIVSPKLHGQAGVEECDRVFSSVFENFDIEASGSTNCGTHVHHSIKDLLKLKMSNELILSKLYPFQESLFMLSEEWRTESSTFCNRISVDDDFIISGRNVAFNISDKDTVEFRMREGLYDAKALSRWIKLTHSVVESAAKGAQNKIKGAAAQVEKTLNALSLEKQIQLMERHNSDFEKELLKFQSSIEFARHAWS